MRTVIISNPSGLHARPCSQIAQLLQNIMGEVYLIKEGVPYNAKSSVSLMRMGAAKGLTIGIEGPDDQVEAMVYEFLSNLDD